MGFETYQNIAKQKLDALHDAGLEASALDQIEAFIASPDVRPAVRAVQSYDDLQIWWQGENERSDEYDHLCLTFAINGLTISLEHRHFDNQFPLFPEETNADGYTLLIKPTRTEAEKDALRPADNPKPKPDEEDTWEPPYTFTSLHLGYSLRANTPPAIYGTEAQRLFQPRFDHTLYKLGFRAIDLSSPSQSIIDIAS